MLTCAPSPSTQRFLGPGILKCLLDAVCEVAARTWQGEKDLGLARRMPKAVWRSCVPVPDVVLPAEWEEESLPSCRALVRVHLDLHESSPPPDRTVSATQNRWL